MQLHALRHFLSRCSRENSGIRYHQPIKSKGGVLLVKSRFRTLRGDRVRSHFPLEEIFQNAQLSSCTRELTGKLCRPQTFFCSDEVENFYFCFIHSGSVCYFIRGNPNMGLTCGSVSYTVVLFFISLGGESIIKNLSLESAKFLKVNSA